jgi:hypothetical protein
MVVIDQRDWSNEHYKGIGSTIIILFINFVLRLSIVYFLVYFIRIQLFVLTYIELW